MQEAALHLTHDSREAVMNVLGVDLAWGESSGSRVANETGVVAVDAAGTVLDAGWRVGIADTAEWIERMAAETTLAMIDAPLVVTNESGQRLCEREVGQRYGRWKVSANSTNKSSSRRGGVALRETLEVSGWLYDDGRTGPPTAGRRLSEVYPYTTLVGTPELGYDTERPVYKRKPRAMRVADFRGPRAATCDELVLCLSGLAKSEVRLDLMSHPTTAKLVTDPSPHDDREYKHREDLIDAVLCAWTGLLWLQQGTRSCQVLGENDLGTPTATIIAPCRPEQRGLNGR
jgi:predicted RNase H-like nuclease